MNERCGDLMKNIKASDKNHGLRETIYGGGGYFMIRKTQTSKKMGADEANRRSIAATNSEHVDSLLEAARYNDLYDVKSLASIGVSLDSKDAEGRTALHMASANGNIDIVNYLISNKVDVNARNVEDNTPLHWACLNGHIEIVKILIIAGADVSRLNKHEQTPVDEAAIGGKMNVIDAINTAIAQIELTRASI
nr:hypothetical protein [Tanacetum cinerariifolium]